MLINKERAKRNLLTIHGTITYTRTILAPSNKESAKILAEKYGRKTVCPIDDELGVTFLPFKITIKAMSKIAREGTKANSYNAAAETLTEILGEPIPTSTVERVTDYVGKIMFRKQCKLAAEAKEAITTRKYDRRKIHRQADDVLFLEIDGAMVYIRDKEHLSMTNEEIQESNTSTNVIPHESAWVESKHAICFHARNIKYYFEQPDGTTFSGRFKDVLKYLDTDIKVTGHTIEKKDLIGYIGNSEQFQYHFLALAERNDWLYCTTIVIISDGAPWIKKLKDLFPGRKIIHILDLFHAKENAGKFAKGVKNGEKEIKEYADYLCSSIEQGKANELLIELKEYENKKMPVGVPNLYTYIKNNKDSMDYPAYKKAGLFVGSGAMESANKYTMQNRMKLPGMRWVVANGRHMLCLKTHHESHTWGVVDEELKKIKLKLH